MSIAPISLWSSNLLFLFSHVLAFSFAPGNPLLPCGFITLLGVKRMKEIMLYFKEPLHCNALLQRPHSDSFYLEWLFRNKAMFLPLLSPVISVLPSDYTKWVFRILGFSSSKKYFLIVFQISISLLDFKCPVFFSIFINKKKTKTNQQKNFRVFFCIHL